MNNNFDYENADRKDLLERCKRFEVSVDAQHALCMKTFKERDTYRELCAYLLHEIKTATVYAEHNIGATLHLKDAIKKAESILGEKNGN